MDIKNVGQLRKVIENLSDDYTIERNKHGNSIKRRNHIR